MSSERELSGLRAQIDRKDLELLTVLAERMKIVDEIGRIKRESDSAIEDKPRETEVISSRVSSGRNRGLDGGFIRELFELILKYSKQREGK